MLTLIYSLNHTHTCVDTTYMCLNYTVHTILHVSMHNTFISYSHVHPCITHSYSHVCAHVSMYKLKCHNYLDNKNLSISHSV
jgi:hypothetical protein